MRNLLSESEVDILTLIAEGLLDKQIAHVRGTAFQTVKNQVQNILKKLKAETRAHAVYKAMKVGIID